MIYEYAPRFQKRKEKHFHPRYIKIVYNICLNSFHLAI